MLAHVGRKSLGAHNCVSLFLNAVSHSVTRAGRDEIGEQMADRSRDTHARGGEAPRRRDSSRDFDRRRDDGGRSSSRWDWKSGDRRPGRDDRRGGGSRRARSRDRAADDRPTKRFRNDPTRGPQPGGHDAPHPPRAGDEADDEALDKIVSIAEEEAFFKLDDDDDEDAARAEKKRGTFVSSKSEEDDPRRLEMRQKQIDFGYNTLGSARYVELVPKSRRSRDKNKHPRTPDAKQVCSKRSFDGQVKKWRRLLHAWDPPVEEDEEVVDVPGVGGVAAGGNEGAREGDEETATPGVGGDRVGAAADRDAARGGAASKTIYDDWEGSDDDFGGV